MNINFGVMFDQITKMINGFFAALPRLALAIGLAVLFVVASKWVQGLAERIGERAGLRRNAGLLVGRLVRWTLLIFGVLIALSVALPSFEPAQLIQLLGIGSVAIGFAFRDILQNFLAGMLILFTEPFQVGDQIVVNDYEGTVEDIQTRATYIRTYDNRIVVIPNADIFTNSVMVNTADPKRRSQYDVGIGYDDDIDTAKSLMLEAMRDIDGVLNDPSPDVLTRELGDSAVVIRARWWTNSGQGDVMKVHDRVVSAIKKKLDAGGIDMPFPVRTVYLSGQSGQDVSVELADRAAAD